MEFVRAIFAVVGLCALGCGGTALFTACGGTAVVDGMNDGAGGDGGTATGSPTGTGTATGSGTATGVGTGTGTGTGAPPSRCTQMCDLLDSCADIRECRDRCEGVNANCRPQHQEWLECLLAVNIQCGGLEQAHSGCSTPLLDYDACEGGLVGGGCAVGGNFCTCDLFADQNTYTSDCEFGGFCQCFDNGNFLGTCADSGNFTCDPILNCCAPMFFVTGR